MFYSINKTNMSTKKISWRTENRLVQDLIPYEKNPRKITEDQAKQLEESFKKFNYVELVAINADNVIIAGHQRVTTLLALGRGNEEIEVRVPSRQLSETEFKEYLLRSNQNGGSWDIDLLREFNVDLMIESGFTDSELTELWDDILTIEDDDFPEGESEPYEKEVTVQTGDYFQLGPHRLICGDSTDAKVVKTLVGDELIHMSYTDVPYNKNLSYDGGISKKKSYGAEIDDNLSPDNYKQFITHIIMNTKRVSHPDAHYFLWLDASNIGLGQKIFAEQEVIYDRTCLWIKNGVNWTPKNAFSKCYEPCLYGKIGKPYLTDKSAFTEILNGDIGVGNATIDDIEDGLDIWLARRLSSDDYEHACQKPLDLHEKPLLRCTKVGDNVLDLCGGSGSTLLACDQMKRVAFIAEKESAYCELIIKRYESYTGNKAVKIN